MASLFKPRILAYKTTEGRKCPKDTPGAKPFRTRARKWYGQFKDAQGRICRVPLCTDKTAARQKLDELVRKVERGEAGLVNPFDEHNRTPLADHLVQYRLHLEAKDNTERHVRETVSQIKKVHEGCQFLHIADLDSEKVNQYLKHRRKEGMSTERSNHYVRSLKGFTRWMVPKRVARDPMGELKTQDAAKDRRLVRRALSPEDFLRLIEATRDSPAVVSGLAGSERAMLYVVAANTGLRASELASLTPESFNLEDMSLGLGASSAKNGRNAELPLHRGLIEQLGRWLEGRPKGLPVWRGKWAVNRHAATMVRADLEAAGMPYVDGRGETFDFHALRGQFVTEMDRAGVSLVKAQRLARHSSPNLTANLYTRLRIEDLKPEVDRLPTPPMVIPKRPDGFALGLAQTADGRVPPGTSEVSDGGRKEPKEGERTGEHKSLIRKQKDAACHDLAGGVIENTEGGTRTHTGVTPPDFESGASAISPLRLGSSGMRGLHARASTVAGVCRHRRAGFYQSRCGVSSLRERGGLSGRRRRGTMAGPADGWPILPDEDRRP